MYLVSGSSWATMSGLSSKVFRLLHSSTLVFSLKQPPWSNITTHLLFYRYWYFNIYWWDCCFLLLHHCANFHACLLCSLTERRIWMSHFYKVCLHMGRINTPDIQLSEALAKLISVLLVWTVWYQLNKNAYIGSSWIGRGLTALLVLFIPFIFNMEFH